MMETVLQKIEYRGYRLTEIRREIKAAPTNALQVLWRITRVECGVENIIAETKSLEAAKARVDGS